MPDINGIHVTIKEYFETRFDELEKRLNATERLNQIALDKALATLEKRLEMLNEFRSLVNDQSKNFATKAMFDNLKDAIDDLKITRATLEGKASQTSANVAMLMGAIALAVTILKLFL